MNSKLRIGVLAIIQARMASKRLPGKVLKDVKGKTVLEWTYERVSQAKGVDCIVVATSVNKKDDEIVDFCNAKNMPVKRGSEEDVLERFYNIANELNYNTILRITSDCPLIDPSVIDRVIQKFLTEESDYASNTLNRSYPRGLDAEVFSLTTLIKAREEATLPSEREHVTPYIWKNPSIFKLTSVEDEDNNSHLRWTVDEEEDLLFLREIYHKLLPQQKNFNYRDILELLTKNPELIKLNQNIKGDTGYKRSLNKDMEYLKNEP
jgi:spore coat polysaccharide biosynthesis protein SpsF